MEFGFATCCFVTLGTPGFVEGARGCPVHLELWFLLRLVGPEDWGRSRLKNFDFLFLFTGEGTEP